MFVNHSGFKTGAMYSGYHYTTGERHLHFGSHWSSDASGYHLNTSSVPSGIHIKTFKIGKRKPRIKMKRD